MSLETLSDNTSNSQGVRMGAREVASTEEVGIFKTHQSQKASFWGRSGIEGVDFWNEEKHALNMQILSFNWIKSKSFCSIFQWVSFNSSLAKDWWLKAFFEVNKDFFMEKPLKKGPQKLRYPNSSSPSYPLLNSNRNKLRWTGPEYCHDCDFTQRGPTRFSFPAKNGVFLVGSPWEAPKSKKNCQGTCVGIFFFGGAGRFAEGLRFGFTSEAEFLKFLQHWSARRATFSWRLHRCLGSWHEVDLTWRFQVHVI